MKVSKYDKYNQIKSHPLGGTNPGSYHCLATGDVTARCRAADALMTAFSRPEIEEMARTALLNALQEPDSGVRSAAASAFRFWNTHLDIIVPGLTQALRDPEPSVRGNAATTLGNFGSAARPAVPELIRLLQDTDIYPVGNGPLHLRARAMLLKIDPKAVNHE